MKQDRPEVPIGSAPPKRHRRFWYRTPADVAILDQLPADQARDFDRTLLEQARAAQRFPAVGDPATLDYIRSEHRSRWTHGPGGGRRRHRETHAATDD